MSEPSAESPVESEASAGAVDPVSTDAPFADVVETVAVAPAAPACQSPPPSPRSAGVVDDPRSQLLQLAEKLTRSRSHRLLTEYLRLRRAIA